MLTINSSGITRIENLAHQTPNCISLSQGAIRIDGIPLEIKNYLANLLQTTKADYYLNPSLKLMAQEAIAYWMEKKYQCTIKPETIIPTHGCMGALSILFMTLLDHNDEVIIPEPAYPLYEHITRIAKAIPKFVSYKHENNQCLWSWDLTLEKIEQTRTAKTKIIVLSNPMNPTGIVLSPDQLKKLVSWCNEHGIYLIVDEVYEDYVFSNNYTTIARYINDSPWVIRTSSLSKSYAMSGWRMGHAIVPKHLIAPLEKTQHSLLVCPSVLGMWASIYAHKHPELIIPYQQEIKKNVSLVHQKLSPWLTHHEIRYIPPEGGFNYFIKLGTTNMNDYCLELIKQAGVSLVPGESFGPSGKGFVRLCYARSHTVVEEGLNRLTSYWTQSIEHTKSIT